MTRPWVVVHNQASLDGRVTIAPNVLLLEGDERWTALGGADDAYAELRREYDPDAILEGSGSFVVEGQALAPHVTVPVEHAAALHADFLPASVVDRIGHRGWFVVVDGRGRVRWQFKEYPDPAWSGWHLLVLTCAATPAGYLAFLREEGIPYLVVGDERVDLGRALQRLGDRLGVRRVLSTGGGRLHGALLRDGLVDEVDLELAPALIGGDATPTLFDGRPMAADEWPTWLEITELDSDGGRLHLRARVRGHEREPERVEEQIQASLV